MSNLPTWSMFTKSSHSLFWGVELEASFKGIHLSRDLCRSQFSLKYIGQLHVSLGLHTAAYITYPHLHLLTHLGGLRITTMNLHVTLKSYCLSFVLVVYDQLWCQKFLELTNVLDISIIQMLKQLYNPVSLPPSLLFIYVQWSLPYQRGTTVWMQQKLVTSTIPARNTDQLI